MGSGSSNKNQYRNGHSGSNYYQRRGILGNLMNVFGSASSHDYHHPGQYPNHPNNNYQGPYPNQPNSYPGQYPNHPQPGATCSSCNSQIPVGAQFCMQCGAKVNQATFCTSCGEKLPPNANFCLKCGTKLNG